MMAEEDITLDDVRWYLSAEMARRLLSYKNQPEELTRFVWKGKLADELYDMEESFVAELEEDLSRKLIDEAGVRSLLGQVRLAKRRRRAL
jgi:hypothetical protein